VTYTSIYPYWTKIPFGWNYPGACVSGKGEKGGWAASVDPPKSKLPFVMMSLIVLELAGNAAANCAGCTAGCTVVWGN